ncbi:7770_t:CDS:2, partial [Gigaspora margarita]
HLNQKLVEYGEAKKLLSGLTDLNYKPGHEEHRYFEYLLPSNARGELTLEDTKNIALLEAYHPEEINSQYIIRVAGKGFTAIDHLSKPKANCSVIWPRTFSSKKSAKEKFQPIEDEDALVKGSNLVIAKYEWLEIGKIEKGLINFRVQLPKECSICEVRHERDQLYEFLLKDRRFILKCFRQKQYKPDHKGLVFGSGLSKRIVNIIKHPRPLVDLSGKNINVKKMEDAPEAYPDFSSEEPTTTLIRSPVATGKTKTLREILNSLAKSEANLPCRSYVVILDEANAIMCQMSSGIHAQESENAMHDLLKSAVHVVAMDAFANESTLAFFKAYRGKNIRIFDNKYQPRIDETVKILYDPDKGSEAMRN